MTFQQVTVTKWGPSRERSKTCLRRWALDDEAEIDQAVASASWTSPSLLAKHAEALRACVEGCGGTAAIVG